ncbi:MAG: carboxymuconolactone decarboxylase family protein [Gammaproteobacteria bacterium]
MTNFTIHTKETAPKESLEILETTEKAYGFLPNLIGVLAESPAGVKGYRTLMDIFDESSFTPTERQVVLIAISRYSECHYCVAAHSTIADIQKVPQDVTDAIRNDLPIADSKLEALRVFTTKVVDQRGWVSKEDTQAFVQAGYNKQQIIEVILGVSVKTLSNYVNHISETPVDDAFAKRSWQPINGTTRVA